MLTVQPSFSVLPMDVSTCITVSANNIGNKKRKESLAHILSGFSKLNTLVDVVVLDKA